MKSKQSKDLISIIILGVLLTFIAIILVNYLGGGKKDRKAEVEVFQPISAQFDERGRNTLLNTDEIKDFVFPIDLNSGFDNKNPFADGN